jgi:hypothetical protein
VAAGLFFCALVSGLSVPSTTAQGKDPKKKDPKKDAKKDPKKNDKKDEAKRSAERVRQYMKQLHARFDAWDADNNNKLDARELARVFRGPKAEPLDKLKIKLPTPEVVLPPTPVKETIPGQIKPVAIALVTLPEPCLPINAAIAELFAVRPKEVVKLLPPPPPKGTPPPKVPDFTRFGDYQFIAVAGKGKDWNISRAEFEAFAKSYASLLDRLDEAERDVTQAKNRLGKAGTPKAKAQARNELDKANGDLLRVQAQWSNIPPAVHKALSIKH